MSFSKRVLLKQRSLLFRKKRVRRFIFGTPDRPRLCVNSSIRNIYAQVIDDLSGKTLTSISTLNSEIGKGLKSRNNRKVAETLGKSLAQKAVSSGIKKVVFDRGSRRYHGRIKAFAEAARKGGLEF